jgi:cell division transport system ATP-binding protein
LDWPKRNGRKIDEVLDKVGMKPYAAKMPHQISGGEQQGQLLEHY